MTAQDLWETNYQILSIFLLKEFKKLNINKYAMIKNMTIAESITKIASALLNTYTLKMIM